MRASHAWTGRLPRGIWLLLANTLLAYTGIGVFSLIFNLYLASLGYREDFIGLFQFANAAAIGGLAVPAGLLSQRAGPRSCLLLASLLTGLAAAAVSLTEAAMLLLAGAAALGAANALLFVPPGPFITESTEGDDRLLAFSLNFAVMSAAMVIGSLLSGYLPSLLASASDAPARPGVGAYRFTLLLGSLACLVSALPLVFVRSPSSVPRVEAGRSTVIAPLVEPVARRLVLPMALASGLLALATGLYLPFFNVYFAQMGTSVQLIGVIFALGSLALVPASLVGPFLTRRLGSTGTVALCRLVAVPFLLLPALAPGASAGAAAFVVRGALMGITWPVDNALAMGLMPPRLRSVVAGVRSATWNFGWSLGSLVAGQLIVLLGYPVIFLAGALLTLVATVLHDERHSFPTRRSSDLS